MTQLIRRHPLTTFFLLVFTITWAVWVPRAAGAPLSAVGQAWTWAPAIAALLAAALTGGRAAVSELGSRVVRWRVGWQWYLVVILEFLDVPQKKFQMFQISLIWVMRLVTMLCSVIALINVVGLNSSPPVRVSLVRAPSGRQ